MFMFTLNNKTVYYLQTKLSILIRHKSHSSCSTEPSSILRSNGCIKVDVAQDF